MIAEDRNEGRLMDRASRPREGERPKLPSPGFASLDGMDRTARQMTEVNICHCSPTLANRSKVRLRTLLTHLGQDTSLQEHPGSYPTYELGQPAPVWLTWPIESAWPGYMERPGSCISDAHLFLGTRQVVLGLPFPSSTMLPTTACLREACHPLLGLQIPWAHPRLVVPHDT